MRIAELYTEVVAKDRPFLSSMKKVQDRAEAVEATIHGMSRAAQGALLAGTASIFGFLKAASDLEESRNKFNAVFKDQADAALSFAQILSDKVNRSVSSLQKNMSGFQDTFVPLGFARDEARMLSQTLTELAVDLGSFNDMETPEAAQALQSAIVGNHESVRKFGVILSQATITAELHAMGLNKTAKTATELEKVMARVRVIMKSTTDAQGDAARTSRDLANQWRGTLDDAYELAASIGETLAPAFKALLEMAQDLINWLKPLVQQFPDMTAGLIAIAGAATAATAALVPMFGAVKAFSMVTGVKMISVLGSLGPLLTSVGAIGAAAFVGWQIGTAIRDMLGLNDAINKVKADAEMLKEYERRGLESQRRAAKYGPAVPVTDPDNLANNDLSYDEFFAEGYKKAVNERVQAAKRETQALMAESKLRRSTYDLELAMLEQAKEQETITLAEYENKKRSILQRESDAQKEVLEAELEQAKAALAASNTDEEIDRQEALLEVTKAKNRVKAHELDQQRLMLRFDQDITREKQKQAEEERRKQKALTEEKAKRRELLQMAKWTTALQGKQAEIAERQTKQEALKSQIEQARRAANQAQGSFGGLEQVAKSVQVLASAQIEKKSLRLAQDQLAKTKETIEVLKEQLDAIKDNKPTVEGTA